MKLEQSQKDDLMELTKSPWFKILEDLVKEMESQLFTPFKTKNVRDKKVQDDLINTQMMLAWAEHLIKTAKSHTTSIVKKKG